MTNNPMKDKGRAITFIREHVGHAGEDCLIWPMARLHNGYGHMGWNGSHYYPHRLMCEFAHGAAPSPKHEVAHLCGKGHEGCVNPRHLAWKTRADNHRDKREHGTQPEHTWKFLGRVTSEQAAEIRALKGQVTQAVLAARFNVSEPTIRDIQLGRSHRPNPKVRGFTPEDDSALRRGIVRGDDLNAIGKAMSRSYGSVRARAYRLGLVGPAARQSA